MISWNKEWSNREAYRRLCISRPLHRAETTRVKEELVENLALSEYCQKMTCEIAPIQIKHKKINLLIIDIYRTIARSFRKTKPGTAQQY